MNALLSRKLFATLVSVLGLLAAGLGTSHAVVLTTGCANTNVSCTLDELNNGASIAIGDKLFSQWLIETEFSAATGPDFSRIDVLALDDQPMNPGLRYSANGQLSVSGANPSDPGIGNLLQMLIIYAVDVTSGPLRIKDNSLSLDDYTFGAGDGGLVDIGESVLDFDINPIGDKVVFADRLFDEFQLFDSVEFDPQTSIFVATLVTVAGDNPADEVALNAFTQRFSQVPEPATGALLALGFAALGLLSLRRKNRT